MHRRNFLKTTAAGALAPLAVSTFAQLQSTSRIPQETVDSIKSRIKPITKEERQQRIEMARRLMEEYNFDALFFEGGTSLNYFTGVNWGRSERLFAMILPRIGDPQYISPKFEEGRAQEQVGTARLL